MWGQQGVWRDPHVWRGISEELTVCSGLCRGKAWGSFPKSSCSPGPQDPDVRPVSLSEAFEEILRAEKMLLTLKQERNNPC